MNDLNQKYRHTAFLALAIVVFSIYLISEYNSEGSSASDEKKSIYMFIIAYLAINMILCILFLYYYSILDNAVKRNDQKFVKDTINRIELYYSIINIFSIPFVAVVILKFLNKYKDDIIDLPPKFSVRY